MILSSDSIIWVALIESALLIFLSSIGVDGAFGPYIRIQTSNYDTSKPCRQMDGNINTQMLYKIDSLYMMIYKESNQINA